MVVMYHLLLLIQREWSQGMGCVPSLPCSQKEEARFTFVYIIGAWLWGGGCLPYIA